MNSKINIPIALKNIENHFSPKIIGEVNDVYIKIVKILGEKVPWHNHKDEDELFYVLEGNLFFEIKGKDVTIKAMKDLAMKGLKIESAAQATSTVKGATVAIEASALTEVKGSLVKIN